MTIGNTLLAFLAGILSILSPCVLPILPIVLGSAASSHRQGPLALAAGLSLSFVGIGLFVATVGHSIGLDADRLRYVAATLMMLVGLVLVVPRLQAQIAVAAGPIGNWADSRLATSRTSGVAGQFWIGVLLGEAMGRAAEVVALSSSIRTDGGCPVAQVNDLSRSLTAFDPISTLVVVVEMSKASWLVSSVVPGVERQPLKKLEPDATALLRLIERWRNEAVRAGRSISRIVLAYEAGRDGFWLARWLIARGIEAHVIHSASVAVSRERKRAKTDRLDVAMLMRVFLGWLRGERGHCGMVAIPTMEEEDARRPSRERESLVDERSRITNRMKSALARLGIRGFKPHLRKAPERLAGLQTAEGTRLPANIIEEFRRDMARLALVREQISSIEKTRAERLERAPDTGPHAMVRLLARVIGIGIETADMLVREILSRKLRDRRAVARYAGLTGSPDESGLKRREKGLAKAGNARVRRGLIQLAWRFLMFQKDSALAQWYRTRTEGPSGARKTTMIVALARKLLIALWRLVTTGEVPDGVELRPAA
jgi:transposase